jgi:SPP1 gp7 family putative phage head morphogenesis protein
MCQFTVNSLDPTRQAGARSKAEAEFMRRLRDAENLIIEFMMSLQPEKTIVKDGPVINRAVYKYELDATRLKQLEEFIRDTLNQNLLEGNDRSFLSKHVGQSYLKGTSLSASRIRRLAAQAGETQLTLSQLDIENIVNTPAFQKRVGLVLQRTFNDMEKFNGDLSVDLSRVIADGMTRGISPRSVAKSIQDKFDTSHSRAITIARTEMNEALRSAKQDEVKEVRQELDLDVRILHQSALLPGRTRRTHAERHGKIYTVEQQEEFYSKDGNSVNCYCSSTEVLVKPDGTVYDAGLIAKMKEQRKSALGLDD